jgi:hypothetical protein
MHRYTCLVLSLFFVLAAFAAARAFPLQREVTVKELIPLNAWQKQFQIMEGKDQGKLVPLTMHKVSAKEDRRKLIFGDYASISMINDTEGGLAMERLDLIKSRSYIVYEPALAILPRNLTSGRAIRHEANFKMYDLATGRLKRTGRTTHLLKKVAHSRFDTPAGVIDGYYIDIDHQMDMQYAKLHISLGLGCRIDDGPVFGSGQYTLTKLGLFTETKKAAAGLMNTGFANN